MSKDSVLTAIRECSLNVKAPLARVSPAHHLGASSCLRKVTLAYMLAAYILRTMYQALFGKLSPSSRQVC